MPPVTPNLNEFKRLAGSANLIPLWTEMPADMDTPVSLYQKLAKNQDAFLLESLEGGERWGRYSFIGLRPFLKVRIKNSDATVVSTKGTEQFNGVNPFDFLRDIMKGFKPAQVEGLPRFYGGAVGFFGYDVVRFIERLPDRLPDTQGFSDVNFMFPSVVIAIDNLSQTLKIIYCASLEEGVDPQLIYDDAWSQIQDVAFMIKKGIDYPQCEGGVDGALLSPEVEESRFKTMVMEAKEYIEAGDIIQVVLSQRFSVKNLTPPFQIYRALRRINPSPYLYFISIDDEILIGSSPEILVRVSGNEVYLRPIAGTRPRGKDNSEDMALEKELLADPKERAEHLMLVDLGRNDLGRVAEIGSVKVDDLMVIERYSHVMHIVSGVRAQLKEGRDMFDVIKACFPAGTVSGAPKIRAMEIIEELEHAKRGPYAGAVGYLGFSGNMDMAITIRTLCQKGDQLSLQAGAGIVADSDPQSEWKETLNKGKGMMRALELARRGY